MYPLPPRQFLRLGQHGITRTETLQVRPGQMEHRNVLTFRGNVMPANWLLFCFMQMVV